MTPLEQSMEEDRKAISAPVAEKQGVEKIIQDAANSPAPEPEPEPEDNDDEDDLEAGTKEDNEPQDKAKPESHAKARITAREEREARIKAEIAAAELRGRMAAEAEFRKQQASQPQPQAQPKVPDPDLEPEAYAQHLINQTRGDVDTVARWSKDQVTALAAQQLNIMADLAETKAAQADPEYLSAKEFLASKQHALLKHQHGAVLQAQNPMATPEQIDAYLRQYAQRQVEEHVITTVQQRGNLAQSIKDMAALYGYAPAAKAEEQKKAEYRPNLQNIKKNMGKSAHLMNGSARGKSGSPSAEQLADAALSDLLGVSSKDYDEALRLH